MSLILALDQSTSATKALLFTVEGNLLDQVSLAHRQFYPQPGWVEHDAEEIYRNALDALRQLLDRHPGAREQLLCLSLTNQRETVVVFDRATGEPLHPAIVWQDRRGEPLCRALATAGHEETVRARTGLKLDTYFPASKLAWLLDQHPELRARVERGEALIGTIDCYLIYRLTGGRCFATDHTNAARTLLYDIGALAWDEGLCELFGVPQHALPEVRESSAHFGESDLEGLLPRPLPICGVMGDSQAALFAQRSFERGSAKVTFGTGSSLLLTLGSQMALAEHGLVTTIGWVYQGEPTYALEGITNFTGATIVWLRDQLGLLSSVEESEALARAVADNGGVYLVPAFVGLSAPHWEPRARAAIVGLTPGSNRNHIVRAALESIAYQVHDLLGLMAAEAGVPLEEVRADGGAVRNHFLMQFVADLTRVTVRASRLPELSALGAVLSGALGMGYYTSLGALAQLPQQWDNFVPTMDKATVQRYDEGWQAALIQVLSGIS